MRWLLRLLPTACPGDECRGRKRQNRNQCEAGEQLCAGAKDWSLIWWVHLLRIASGLSHWQTRATPAWEPLIPNGPVVGIVTTAVIRSCFRDLLSMKSQIIAKGRLSKRIWLMKKRLYCLFIMHYLYWEWSSKYSTGSLLTVHKLTLLSVI